MTKNNSYKRKYGITLEDFNQMLFIQNNCCAICRCEMIGKKQERNAPVVDHCHNTLEIRAILCNTCNKMIGFAKDDIDTLKNAINYLNIFKEE